MRSAALIALALLLPAGPVSAHEVRPGYLYLIEEAPAEFAVTWQQPALADRRLPLEPQLPAECSTLTTGVPEHTGAALIQRWRTGCSLRAGTLTIGGLSGSLTDVLVRIEYLDGDTVSRVLRPADPDLDLAEGRPAAPGYFMLGVEHLLLGADHLLFVIGLVLFIRSPWSLIKAVTAFTVAHSVTLALSVLELVTLPQGPVEALIAVSILFLARELMLPVPARSPLIQASPWIMALCFGLLHGFGFAGALADVGLPRDQLAVALLWFNLGIEVGQLAVIGLILFVAALGRRLARGLATTPEPAVHRAVTVAMGCAAGFWTVDRVVALW